MASSLIKETDRPWPLSEQKNVDNCTNGENDIGLIMQARPNAEQPKAILATELTSMQHQCCSIGVTLIQIRR